MPTAGQFSLKKRYVFGVNCGTTEYIQATAPFPTAGGVEPEKRYNFGANHGIMSYLQTNAPDPTAGLESTGK